jgi:uncharacterized protein
MMPSAEYWINHLSLMPHPEGGFYKEVYRSTEHMPTDLLPTRYDGPRVFSTSIYFLLRSQDRSVFHRLKSDEIWHFYAGSAATIYLLSKNGVKESMVGNKLERQETLQVLIPAGTWFSAEVKEPDSYCLVGCTVAPGFEFSDFEMADRNLLLRQYPEYSGLVERFTHANKF